MIALVRSSINNKHRVLLLYYAKLSLKKESPVVIVADFDSNFTYLTRISWPYIFTDAGCSSTESMFSVFKLLYKLSPSTKIWPKSGSTPSEYLFYLGPTQCIWWITCTLSTCSVTKPFISLMKRPLNCFLNVASWPWICLYISTPQLLSTN